MRWFLFQAPPPLPVRDPVLAQRVSEFALLMLILSIAVLALLCAALVWALLRVRAREHALKAGKEPRTTPVLPDPWIEAGKRAQPATTEALTAQAAKPMIDPSVADRPLALVTGAARRVGRAIALELARSGCNILFTYRESYEEAASLGKEIAAMGSQATMFHLDLASEASVLDFAQRVTEMLPRLDILVHNASIFEPSPLAELTLTDIERQYRINAGAPLLITGKLRGLLERSAMPGGACVVALTDVQALGKPRQGYSSYAMSKAALHQMVQNLARELAPKVRVNGVAPGVVAWPEQGEDADEATQKSYLRRVPLGRAGVPTDAARAVRWLAFDAPYVTGEVIRLDGGRSLT